MFTGSRTVGYLLHPCCPVRNSVWKSSGHSSCNAELHLIWKTHSRL